MDDDKLSARLADVRKQNQRPPAVDLTPTPTSDLPSRRAPATQAASRVQAGERWEDKNRRATFHLPNELLAELAAFCETNERSKGDVVRSAIEAYIR